jgi:hypothetical protein
MDGSAFMNDTMNEGHMAAPFEADKEEEWSKREARNSKMTERGKRKMARTRTATPEAPSGRRWKVIVCTMYGR